MQPDGTPDEGFHPIEQLRNVVGGVLGMISGRSAREAIRVQRQEQDTMTNVAMALAGQGTLHEAPEFSKHLGKYMSKDAIENLTTLSTIAKHQRESGQGQSAIGDALMSIASPEMLRAQVQRGEQQVQIRGQDVAADTAAKGQAGETARVKMQEDAAMARTKETEAGAMAREKVIQAGETSRENTRINEEHKRSTELHRAVLMKELIKKGNVSPSEIQAIGQHLEDGSPIPPELDKKLAGAASQNESIRVAGQNLALAKQRQEIIGKNGLGGPQFQTMDEPTLKSHIQDYNESVYQTAENQIRMATSDKEANAIIREAVNKMYGVGQEASGRFGGAGARKLITTRDVPAYSKGGAKVLINPGDYTDKIQRLSDVEVGSARKATSSGTGTSSAGGEDPEASLEEKFLSE